MFEVIWKDYRTVGADLQKLLHFKNTRVKNVIEF